MGLVKDIRHERAQQQAKIPFRRTLFDRINAIVKRHALGKEFLASLTNFSDHHLGEHLAVDGMRPKDHWEPPLFSLSSEAEYRVTTAIIDIINNPYLHFVTLPEEILLCRALFRRDPTLAPEKLAQYHFATLLIELGGPTREA
jgi:hypothetical protein